MVVTSNLGLVVSVAAAAAGNVKVNDRIITGGTDFTDTIRTVAEETCTGVVKRSVDECAVNFAKKIGSLTGDLRNYASTDVPLITSFAIDTALSNAAVVASMTAIVSIALAFLNEYIESGKVPSSVKVSDNNIAKPKPKSTAATSTSARSRRRPGKKNAAATETSKYSAPTKTSNNSASTTTSSSACPTGTGAVRVHACW
ncbi:hypothetical protein MMC21_008091 [Puttea exsequens]|nr:hypothetical protein [Puttea exsequens]